MENELTRNSGVVIKCGGYALQLVDGDDGDKIDSLSYEQLRNLKPEEFSFRISLNENSNYTIMDIPETAVMFLSGLGYRTKEFKDYKMTIHTYLSGMVLDGIEFKGKSVFNDVQTSVNKVISILMNITNTNSHNDIRKRNKFNKEVTALIKELEKPHHLHVVYNYLDTILSYLNVWIEYQQPLMTIESKNSYMDGLVQLKVMMNIFDRQIARNKNTKDGR